MSLANFKPKRIASAPRGFLAAARLFCFQSTRSASVYNGFRRAFVFANNCGEENIFGKTVMAPWVSAPQPALQSPQETVVAPYCSLLHVLVHGSTYLKFGSSSIHLLIIYNICSRPCEAEAHLWKFDFNAPVIMFSCLPYLFS